METGVLERIRAFEADIERTVDSMVQQELFRELITNDRHRILLDHFKVMQAKKIASTAEKLLDLYLDEDDIVEVQEAPSEGADALAVAMSEFEKKVADIREYHSTYRELPPIRTTLDLPDPKLLDTLFSSAERFGHCFDLEPHYNRYSSFVITLNTVAAEAKAAAAADETGVQAAPGSRNGDLIFYGRNWGARLEYFQFIPQVPTQLIQEIDAFRKIYGFESYEAFVSQLLAYLTDFYHRVHPLDEASLPRLQAATEQELEEYWSELHTHAGAITLEHYEDLATKEELAKRREQNEDEDELEAPRHRARKLSCGLTIPPPLRRFVKKFSLWPLEQLQTLLSDGHAGKERAGLPPSLEGVKQVCLKEAHVASLLQSLLFTTLQETEKVLQRDYSKTLEEMELDRARQQQEFLKSLNEVREHTGRSVEGTIAQAAQYHLAATLGDSEAAAEEEERKKEAEEEEQQKKNVFLGDGEEPVAKWLVTLQQLDKNFVCEICGGTVYHGPKIYREHFGSERHAEGLRRLGITMYLKGYEGIATIREVIEMRDRGMAVPDGLRKRMREDADNEEIQDAQGKVVTTKDYKRFQNKRQQ
ncbi:splicing factor 3A subunit 3 [Strigomonas culicis]|uniref:Splicing factor 3A subunit 3 n=1 Tax=Strigomonas culicis TaxID=28005 RepID=S9UIP0_9TRYP|nr:splicing factor 3A subunit 3 [Strigomonas culicis]|eukprot:EPY28584.1 splicing factor 3A subunit 3 [Strigomonas culicis]